MTLRLPSPTSPLSALEPFASIDLIAVDIDGTLASAEAPDVADLIKVAVKSLSHYGVTVTVATGRAVAGAKSTIFGLNERLGPAIVYNGSVVVDLGKDQLIARSPISALEVADIRDLVLESGAAMWAYDCSSPSVDQLDTQVGNGILEIVHGWSRNVGPNVELNGLPVSWSSSRTRADEAVAILVARQDGKLHGLVRDLRSMSTISITSSTPDFLEIRPAGTTKASALALVASQRGLTRQRVLTIGDNHNDIEMLQWAGMSIAVANATDAARAASSFTATQSDARGVVEALRLVISAKRFARGYALAPRTD